MLLHPTLCTSFRKSAVHVTLSHIFYINLNKEDKIIHSFIFSNQFILVGLWQIWSLSQEHSPHLEVQCIAGHNAHTDSHLGNKEQPIHQPACFWDSGKKSENLKETQTDAGRSCTETTHGQCVKIVMFEQNVK